MSDLPKLTPDAQARIELVKIKAAEKRGRAIDLAGAGARLCRALPGERRGALRHAPADAVPLPLQSWRRGSASPITERRAHPGPPADLSQNGISRKR